MQTIRINNTEMQVGEELIHFQLRATPQSGNVSLIGINSHESKLYVQFKHGQQYVYKKVPQEILTGALNCTDSIGRYIRTYLIGKFEFDKPAVPYLVPIATPAQ